MFSQATSFNRDLTDWDVASVTSMAYVFNLATSFHEECSPFYEGTDTCLAPRRTSAPATSEPTPSPTRSPTAGPTTSEPTPSPTRAPSTSEPTPSPTQQPTAGPATLRANPVADPGTVHF